MNIEENIGLEIHFTVSEPEEFFFNNGEGPFNAKIVAFSKNKHYLLEVKSDLVLEGNKLVYLIISGRYKEQPVQNIKALKKIIVNYLPVILTKEEYSKLTYDQVFEKAESWRGIHLIGSVRLND